MFVISAVFAALAGSLTAHYAGFITPSKVGFLHSIELVTMVVFGGMASTFGAVVGAAVLTMLPQLLTVFKDYEMVVFGAVMMGTMIFLPRGLRADARVGGGDGTAGRRTAASGRIASDRRGALRRDGAGDERAADRRLAQDFGGVRAVDDLTFEIERGAVHSIIGPNGAGKTTLLNLLTGVYAPSAGRIYFDERDLTGRAPHEFAARGMARTFQNLQVFFNMSALENVMVGAHLHERCGLWRRAAAQPAPRRRGARLPRGGAGADAFVGLEAWVDAAADALPYGALKRLEIARALAARPQLLLLDEPAAGLNPTETMEIDALIAKLAGGGITVVLVEHNMRLVMGVSDRILVLDYGRKLAEGDGRDGAQRPARDRSLSRRGGALTCSRFRA